LLKDGIGWVHTQFQEFLRPIGDKIHDLGNPEMYKCCMECTVHEVQDDTRVSLTEARDPQEVVIIVFASLVSAG